MHPDGSFDHKSNVRKLLKDFMLDNCAETRVEKCSGGQMKRLVIALELTPAVKPNLICLDEPTSGLDSNSAVEVSKKVILMRILPHF